MYAMREILIEMRKQLLSIFRLLAFLPGGFCAGLLAKIILDILCRISTFGKIDPNNYWDGGALVIGLSVWVCTYAVSALIKPNFITPKIFVISWSFVLGIFLVTTIDLAINPPYANYPIQKDVMKTLIPTAVLIWFVKDKSTTLYTKYPFNGKN